MRRLILLVLTLFTLAGPAPLRALNIFIASSGNSPHDLALAGILSGAGHSVTQGAAWYDFDGNQDLSMIDVVFLQANYNWNGGDMLEAGQTALTNFVAGGGGLITSAWLNYNIHEDTDYGTLAALLPVTNPQQEYESTDDITFTLVARNPAITDGLSNTFAFSPADIGGSESMLLPKPGAVVYCSSGTVFDVPGRGAGLAGWLYGDGRVACFSNTCGQDDFSSADFQALFLNVIDWTQQADSVPVFTIKGGSSQKFKSSKATVKGTATDPAGIYTVSYRIGNKGAFRKAKGTTAWQFSTKLKTSRAKGTIRVTNGNGVTVSKTFRLSQKGR